MIWVQQYEQYELYNITTIMVSIFLKIDLIVILDMNSVECKDKISYIYIMIFDMMVHDGQEVDGWKLGCE